MAARLPQRTETGRSLTHQICGQHGNTSRMQVDRSMQQKNDMRATRQGLKNRGGPISATKNNEWKAWELLKNGGRPPNATENNVRTAREHLKNKGGALQQKRKPCADTMGRLKNGGGPLNATKKMCG